MFQHLNQSTLDAFGMDAFYLKEGQEAIPFRCVFCSPTDDGIFHGKIIYGTELSVQTDLNLVTVPEYSEDDKVRTPNGKEYYLSPPKTDDADWTTFPLSDYDS